MRLSILIYDGLTALDAIGGYEILARLPGMETEFVASRRGIIAADTRSLGLVAFREFSEVTATDILYVPGGPGGFALETDEIFLDTIRRLDKTSTWTVGICNGVGSLVCRSISFCWRSLGPSTILTLEGFTVKTQYPFGAGDLAEQPNPGAASHIPIPPQIGRKLGKRARLEGVARRPIAET